MENQERTILTIGPDFTQEVIDRDVDLLILAKCGDSAALDRLVFPRLSLVEAIAESFRDNGVEYFDLIHLGADGLKEAVYSFDIFSGDDFSRYAVSQIRQSMDAVVSRECKAEYLESLYEPQTKLDVLLSKFSDRDNEILRMRFGFDNYRGYTIAEVSREFGIPEKEVELIQEEAIRELHRII